MSALVQIRYMPGSPQHQHSPDLTEYGEATSGSVYSTSLTSHSFSEIYYIYIMYVSLVTLLAESEKHIHAFDMKCLRKLLAYHTKAKNKHKKRRTKART